MAVPLTIPDEDLEKELVHESNLSWIDKSKLLGV